MKKTLLLLVIPIYCAAIPSLQDIAIKKILYNITRYKHSDLSNLPEHLIDRMYRFTPKLFIKPSNFSDQSSMKKICIIRALCTIHYYEPLEQKIVSLTLELTPCRENNIDPKIIDYMVKQADQAMNMYYAEHPQQNLCILV